jgi:hypothetical protein
MKPRITLSLAALLCVQAFRSQAQSFSIDWFTIAGGGGTSTGGLFSVSATIGQHEAGSMSGGQFTLTGGFWGATAVQTPGAPSLVITPTGSGQATLTWSTDTAGFHLQISDTLEPPAWTNAPSGTTHPITVPATGPRRYYRLAWP